ncbi:MAG TPA: hypothetical protein VFJ97_00920 [Dermatophilaceae bacterium]|nr:hypothetical protein [Dermatophilaceae bacterium]
MRLASRGDTRAGRRLLPVLTLVVALSGAAACSSASSAGSPSSATPSVSAPAASARSTPQRETPATAADRKLIAAMYARINAAFRKDPNAGVRAVIAAQYPGAASEVDFARCVNAIRPGAKELPKGVAISFTPNIKTTVLEPGYTITLRRGGLLHPEGRIYSTMVAISGTGIRAANHQRHQVVRNGTAYQFSSC